VFLDDFLQNPMRRVANRDAGDYGKHGLVYGNAASVRAIVQQFLTAKSKTVINPLSRKKSNEKLIQHGGCINVIHARGWGLTNWRDSSIMEYR
jgi:hypothetical protein